MLPNPVREAASRRLIAFHLADAVTVIGGGVCQVSTTVFRAVVFAGLPISDWAEHTPRLPVHERDG